MDKCNLGFCQSCTDWMDSNKPDNYTCSKCGSSVALIGDDYRFTDESGFTWSRLIAPTGKVVLGGNG